MGARAAGRSAWLVAPGLLVAFLRFALGWPATLFAVGMARAGIMARIAAGEVRPGAILAGALEALASPRALAILAGLWGAGVLASAALRVAWLAGVLPTLGEELSRSPEPRPRFAEGVAFGFAPILGTAVLASALELAAQLYSITVFAAALLLAAHPLRPGYVIPAAALGAAALTAAVALPFAASLAADAALARTALAGEHAPRALAEGVRRVLGRPGAFLVAGLGVGTAAFMILGSAQAVEAAALGIAPGAPAVLVVGPRLMATVLVSALSALLELWRLGTVAALACADAR